MKPLKFKPIFMERIWGGDTLKSRYNFDIPENKKIGEMWCLSDNTTAVSVIDDGEYAGVKINELTKKFYREIYGDKHNYERFPLLIKLIDAHDKLSVQVHPDDEYAYKYENGDSGKTEMWYIIDAKPGAKLICGLKKGTTKEQFKKLLEHERLEECLNEIEVNPGDVVYIPSGMVHAIGDGILICEIQQNSDLTYRVYDYNRVDTSGRKRQLHVNKALDVIDFNLRGDKIVPDFRNINGGRISEVLRTKYFSIDIFKIDTFVKIIKENIFNTLTVIDNPCKLKYKEGEINIKAGETILMPAQIDEFYLEGNSKIIRAYI